MNPSIGSKERVRLRDLKRRIAKSGEVGRSSRAFQVRYGLYVPNFCSVRSPCEYVKLAKEAERTGWDGFFIWDHLVEWNKRVTVFDSFILLSAIAVNTKKIRIGTTVTPLPRLWPWTVARQVATLDHFSNGRMILGVGLGGEESSDYERFGQSGDLKTLAEMVDESLLIINGLWSGKWFSYENGKHYHVGRSLFLPRPVQRPRIPIWVGGMWPRKGAFHRAARWDGTIPLKDPGNLLKPNELQQILRYLKSLRGNLSNFDVAVIGRTSGRNRQANSEKVSRYIDAGMTWWLESLYTERDSLERMLERIRLGPPVMQI